MDPCESGIETQIEHLTQIIFTTLDLQTAVLGSDPPDLNNCGWIHAHLDPKHTNGAFNSNRFLPTLDLQTGVLGSNPRILNDCGWIHAHLYPILNRVADPHSFDTDPDPAFYRSGSRVLMNKTEQIL